MVLLARDLQDPDKEDIRDVYGEWLFAARPVFMTSRSFQILKMEMANYVRGTSAGRSFLIAADRGGGKTSMVLRAAEDLERETISAWTATATDRQPRRPLIVKLHASVLVAPAVKADTPAWVRAPAPAAEVTPAFSAETALQQITIALYRALAREVSLSFARHAREIVARPPQGRTPAHDLLERAGQLTLDLDLAPDPATLRANWRLLDRLGIGVLWPQKFTAGDCKDRGIREIVAIVTANQAFQVCSGNVTSRQSASGSAQREMAVESQARIDVKDALNQALSLAAGALAGAALLHDQNAWISLAAGLGTAVASTAALGWHSSRKLKTDRNTDYTFIVDRTVQTLDRDLPVVIDRIRETGLAPVFIVDELDKLGKAQKACIETLMRRLKSLTTDNGFFCFLTDSEYFNEVDYTLRTTAYPPEHTFFSHRLLVIYRPVEVASYIQRLWVTEPPSAGADGNVMDRDATLILTRVVLQRAHMNFMNIRREVAGLCGKDGVLLQTAAEICTARTDFHLALAFQLAVEVTLKQPGIQRRIENDDAFAQLALDILFSVSRAWEDGQPAIDLDAAEIRKELIRRRGIVADSDDLALEVLSRSASDKDIDLIAEAAFEMARMLTSFATIRDEVTRSAAALVPADQADLTALCKYLSGVSGGSEGLLRPSGTQPSTAFEFCFDYYGVERLPKPDDVKLLDLNHAVEFFDHVTLALSDYDLSIGALAKLGVLPGTLDQTALEKVVRQIRVSFPARSYRQAAWLDVQAAVQPEAMALLMGLPSNVRLNSRAVVAIVALCGLVAETARIHASSVTGTDALAALGRMLGLVPLAQILNATSDTSPLRNLLKSPQSSVVDALLGSPPPATEGPDNADWLRPALQAEQTRLTQVLLVTTALITPSPGPAEVWYKRVSGWLSDDLQSPRPAVTYPDPPVTYEDIVGAAARFDLPSTLRPDLHTMSAAEWSRFAMLSFQASSAMAAFFPAALRALGFPGDLVPVSNGDGLPFTFLWAGGRPPVPGVLHIDDGRGDIGGPPDPAAGPVFVVPRGSQQDYAPVLNWLHNQHALGAYSP